jgi:hypothetical protein
LLNKTKSEANGDPSVIRSISSIVEIAGNAACDGKKRKDEGETDGIKNKKNYQFFIFIFGFFLNVF